MVHAAAEDYIFGTRTGTALDHRHIGTAFRLAVRRADLGRTSGRLSVHSLRHGYASTLISQGLNVVFVSRQLGHADANVTLAVNAHNFQTADHIAAARQALETSSGPRTPTPPPASPQTPPWAPQHSSSRVSGTPVPMETAVVTTGPDHQPNNTDSTPVCDARPITTNR